MTLENVGEAGSYGLEDGCVAKGWIVEAGGVEEEGKGVGNRVELGKGGTFVGIKCVNRVIGVMYHNGKGIGDEIKLTRVEVMAS